MVGKNKVSHRGKAIAGVVKEFDKILAWLDHRLAEAKPPNPPSSKSPPEETTTDEPFDDGWPGYEEPFITVL